MNIDVFNTNSQVGKIAYIGRNFNKLVSRNEHFVVIHFDCRSFRLRCFYILFLAQTLTMTPSFSKTIPLRHIEMQAVPYHNTSCTPHRYHNHNPSPYSVFPPESTDSRLLKRGGG